MGKIDVNTGEVDRSADKLTESNDEISRLVKLMYEIRDRIEDSWKGAGAAEFLDCFDGTIEKLLGASGRVDDVSTVLKKITADIRQTEEDLAKIVEDF